MARPRRTRERIAAAPTSVAAVVGAVPAAAGREPFLVASAAELERAAGSAEGETADAVRLFFENGGTHAWVVGLDESRPRRSLDLLEDLDFNLLVVPATARLGRATSLAVDAALLAGRRRAFYLVDPPADRTAATVVRWARSFGGGRNAAVYFPRLRVRGRAGEREVAAAGAVAGLIARADRERGVWKASGEQESLRGIVGPALDVPEDASAALADAGVNAIRRPASGPARITSGRTREESDRDWKYVSVRRFALFVEESVEQGTRWTVFEPNDERLWAQVRAAVRTFLRGLLAQGAFPASRAADAFVVRCDRTTTTEDDIAAGRVVVQVGVAPLRPAEFVTVRIGLQARCPDG
ncbi:MAG TPA: phage tail sheath C-terminal domain-containing protein [Gaiellaceae bacterium]|nr:phage tail sheath C-terminal domain-containing protein [Gaiellaceae bacterium]